MLLADEVDAYKASAGKEGDPVMLAEQRQTTYWDYKTVLVSTPTDKNNSRILDEFNASTQEEWTVPCPNCGFINPLFGTTWYSTRKSGRKAACNTAAPSAAALTTNTAGRRTACKESGTQNTRSGQCEAST